MPHTPVSGGGELSGSFLAPRSGPQIEEFIVNQPLPHVPQCWHVKTIKCVAATLLLAFSLSANTYYVDSIAGNDSNNGTTSPWKSLAKVSRSTFSPGDQVL